MHLWCVQVIRLTHSTRLSPLSGLMLTPGPNLAPVILMSGSVYFLRNDYRLKSIRIHSSALNVAARTGPDFSERRRRKPKQCPFLHNDVISTLELWVAEASCHCVLVSIRMSCLGEGRGGWGGCWKEDVTVSHSFANEDREHSAETWICSNIIF